jgi:tRNA G18 (ribose-2'-O)-methylase SpoU
MEKKDLERWTRWTRNVKDEYKALSNEEIKADLRKKQLPFSILCAQLEGDFNFGSVIRAANNFGATDVYYYGKKKYDRRANCGVHNYTDVIYLSSLDEIKALKHDPYTGEGYFFVALENNITKNTVKLDRYIWPQFNLPTKTMMVVGEEGCGISAEVLELCNHFVEIPSVGSVRSLNVGGAASIAMWEFYRQWNTTAK